MQILCSEMKLVEREYHREKLNDELVTIYQQILHSEVSQPLSPEQLVT